MVNIEEITWVDIVYVLYVYQIENDFVLLLTRIPYIAQQTRSGTLVEPYICLVAHTRLQDSLWGHIIGNELARIQRENDRRKDETYITTDF